MKMNKPHGQDQWEKDFEELRKIAQKTGIEDLMIVYGNYQKYIEISMRYLKEMDAKVKLSTTNNTY